jgi:hypothetical protein
MPHEQKESNYHPLNLDAIQARREYAGTPIGDLWNDIDALCEEVEALRKENEHFNNPNENRP